MLGETVVTVSGATPVSTGAFFGAGAAAFVPSAGFVVVGAFFTGLEPSAGLVAGLAGGFTARIVPGFTVPVEPWTTVGDPVAFGVVAVPGVVVVVDFAPFAVVPLAVGAGRIFIPLVGAGTLLAPAAFSGTEGRRCARISAARR